MGEKIFYQLKYKLKKTFILDQTLTKLIIKHYLLNLKLWHSSKSKLRNYLTCLRALRASVRIYRAYSDPSLGNLEHLRGLLLAIGLITEALIFALVHLNLVDDEYEFFLVQFGVITQN